MECLIGAGVKQFVKVNAGENALSQLSTMMKNASGSSSWLFGHLGYDLKNDIENLTSSNPDEAEFDDLYFLFPKLSSVLMKMSFGLKLQMQMQLQPKLNQSY
jgi:para-aminobenzoate synthetase component 1